MEQGAGPATQFAYISAQLALLRSINELTKACYHICNQAARAAVSCRCNVAHIFLVLCATAAELHPALYDADICF